MNNFRKSLHQNVFRSSQFYTEHELSDNRITTIIDLRRPEVIKKYPTLSNNINIVMISLVDSYVRHEFSFKEVLALLLSLDKPKFAIDKLFEDSVSLASFYMCIAVYGKKQMKQVFEIFTRKENFPVLIHCVSGKDRTGIIIAVLNELKGISRSKTVEEYSKSEENLSKMLPKMKETIKTPLLSLKTIASKPQVIILFLRSFYQRFKSIEYYLIEHIGLSRYQVECIKQNI